MELGVIGMQRAEQQAAGSVNRVLVSGIRLTVGLCFRKDKFNHQFSRVVHRASIGLSLTGGLAVLLQMQTAELQTFPY